MTTPHILYNTGARSINTVSIWVWLLTGNADLIVAVSTLLTISGNYTKANRLLSEAYVWNIL